MRFEYRVVVITADVVLPPVNAFAAIDDIIDMAAEGKTTPQLEQLTRDVPGLTFKLGGYTVEADFVATAALFAQPPTRWTRMSDRMYVFTEKIPVLH